MKKLLWKCDQNTNTTIKVSRENIHIEISTQKYIFHSIVSMNIIENTGIDNSKDKTNFIKYFLDSSISLVSLLIFTVNQFDSISEIISCKDIIFSLKSIFACEFDKLICKTLLPLAEDESV